MQGQRKHVPDLGSSTAVAADGANLCNACWMEIAHAAKFIKWICWSQAMKALKD